jgi:gas vesicle protein
MELGMSKVFSSFKRIELSRILTIVAISLLMLVSTACSRADATDVLPLNAPSSSSPKNTPSSSSPNPPGQVQPYQGGINNFDDVDTTRLSKDNVDAKAKALKDRVERNINQKGIDSPEQYVKNFRSGTPLNERLENIGDDLGQSAGDIKENLQEFGTRGSKNLERNVKSVPEQAARTFDQAKQNAKAASEDISNGVKDPIDQAGNVLNRAGDFAQDAADDTVANTKRAIN